MRTMLRMVGLVLVVFAVLGVCAAFASMFIPTQTSQPSQRTEPYVMPSEDELRALLSNPANRELGQSTYTGLCSACHGANGEGGQGPNLSDDYWLHGSDMRQILTSIREGYPQKGMAMWKGSYTPEQIHGLAVFVVQLKGNPMGTQKAPEGTLAPITYWPVPLPKLGEVKGAAEGASLEKK
jgi:mono/diheme cytochrome c family protein